MAIPTAGECKRQMKAHKLTLQVVADSAGVTVGHVSRMLSGERKWTPKIPATIETIIAQRRARAEALLEASMELALLATPDHPRERRLVALAHILADMAREAEAQ